MSGLGVKKFVSGEVLTAAELNGYLMDQAVCVFDTVGARDAAFGDLNEPSLSEGRICYIKATNKVQYYDGSAWVDSEQFSISANSQVSPGILQLDRLVSGTPGQLVVCDSSGVPTYVTLANDATINSSGQLTIGSTAVTLGTETVGDYVERLTAGTGVTITNNSGESSSPTIAIGQNVATTASPTFSSITLGGITLNGNQSVSGSMSVSGNAVYHISTASVASGGSILAGNDGQLVELTGNNATLTVPGSGWTVGSQITIMQMGTGSASITFTGATDIKATPKVSASVVALRTQYSTATIINRGTSDWYVIGDLRN